jgi:hypothetical protein
VRARSLDDALDEVARVEELAPKLEGTDVELVREQDVVDDPPEPLGLVHDQRDEPLPARLVQGEIVPPQRLGGAVDGGQRGAQLVRGRGDELRLQLLEPPCLGEVAKGVHRSVEELHSRDGDPALPVLRLEWHGLRLHGLGSAHRDPIGQCLPLGDDLRRLGTHHRLGVEARDRLHRRIPESDGASPVDEEDAVGDVREHVGGV